MNLPFTLAEAAARLAPMYNKRSHKSIQRMLGHEGRVGRLNVWKLAGTVMTDEGAIEEWLCRAKDFRPASTSDKADPPDGSSETDPERSAQATAQSVAEMLQNFKPLSANTLRNVFPHLKALPNRER